MVYPLMTLDLCTKQLLYTKDFVIHVCIVVSSKMHKPYRVFISSSIAVLFSNTL